MTEPKTSTSRKSRTQSRPARRQRDDLASRTLRTIRDQPYTSAAIAATAATAAVATVGAIFFAQKRRSDVDTGAAAREELAATSQALQDEVPATFDDSIDAGVLAY